jgi:hypothetical protein
MPKTTFCAQDYLLRLPSATCRSLYCHAVSSIAGSHAASTTRSYFCGRSHHCGRNRLRASCLPCSRAATILPLHDLRHRVITLALDREITRLTSSIAVALYPLEFQHSWRPWGMVEFPTSTLLQSGREPSRIHRRDQRRLTWRGSGGDPQLTVAICSRR